MKPAFAAIQARRPKPRRTPGIGIACGYASLGPVGADASYNETAIGNAVNFATHLRDLAGDGQILIDKRAQIEVEGAVPTEPIGEPDLKCVCKPVEAFSVTGAG